MEPKEQFRTPEDLENFHWTGNLVREGRTEKDQHGNIFTSTLLVPLPKLRAAISRGLQSSQTEKLKGAAISLPKAFCNLEWNGTLGRFFLSSSGLRTTTAQTSGSNGWVGGGVAELPF